MTFFDYYRKISVKIYHAIGVIILHELLYCPST